MRIPSIRFIQISDNGLISLGSSFAQSIPESFPTDGSVIAPYWDNIDLNRRGRVFYDLLNCENGSEVLKNISIFINSVQKMDESFEASSAIVIYWRDTCPFGNPTCSNVRVLKYVYYSCMKVAIGF